MTEGWIIVGVVIGSLGTLATAYATQRWTRQATIASERRQARVDERRQAVAPIRAFLDRAAKASGRLFMEEAAAAAYDSKIVAVQQIVQKIGSRERVFDILTRDVQEEPSTHQLPGEAIAAMANAPTAELASLVYVVLVAAAAREKQSTAELRQGIERARRLIEDYVVGGLEDSQS